MDISSLDAFVKTKGASNEIIDDSSHLITFIRARDVNALVPILLKEDNQLKEKKTYPPSRPGDPQT